MLAATVAPASLCAVVKADCYGHGVSTLLGLMNQLADCLAVATPEEVEGEMRHLLEALAG